MLLDVGSTNEMDGLEHAGPLKLLPCAELECCRIAPTACLITLERPDEKKKERMSLHPTASVFELIFTCIRASLETGFDCVVGGLSLVASWLDLPERGHTRSHRQHIEFDQTLVSDKKKMHMIARYD